ncbi:MAG: hypothetical protein JSR91_21905 [Proteobacteria bacterium]|nr:hypothetical protein [Pseudomonadota bacterium]
MRAIAGSVGVLVTLPAAVGAPAQNKVPGQRSLEAPVKPTLPCWNDANVTGNDTGLHAKPSRPSGDQFLPDRLKQAFKKFADGDIDIAVIGAMKPTYDPAPAVDARAGSWCAVTSRPSRCV